MRAKGARDTKPRKPRADKGAPKKATPSAATRRAMDRAEGDMSNSGINSEAAIKLKKRLIAGYHERNSIMGSALNACKQVHDVDKAALKDAKERGIPTRAAKADFALWILQYKAEQLRAKLEPDDAALLRQLQEALGGPLGAYAGEQAAKREASASNVVNIKPGIPTEADMIAENKRRLEDGISQLAAEDADAE